VTGAHVDHQDTKTTGALARLTAHLIGRHETTARAAGPGEVLLAIPAP
jgi:hypothetical protein